MTRMTHILLAGAVALCSACAVQDGEPWGWVDGAAGASGAIVERGGKPASSVTIATADATIDVRLVETISGSSASGAAFDPQSPPDGYGLCHNGHCHSDDGELVPYDEIRRALESGGGAVENTVARMTTQGSLTAPLPLERVAIPDPATVDTVQVEFNLSLTGTATIDDDTYTLEIVTGPFEMSAPADLAFGPDAPAEQSIEVDAAFETGSFFATLDWSSVETSGDTIKFTQIINSDQRDALIAALQEGALSLSMRR